MYEPVAYTTLSVGSFLGLVTLYHNFSVAAHFNEGGLQNQPRLGDGITMLQPRMEFNNFKRRTIPIPPTATDAAVQRHATCRRDWPGGHVDGTRTRNLRRDNPAFYAN